MISVKLIEMSESYREQYRVLDGRIRQLSGLENETENDRELCLLRERIRVLVVMRQEARELAVVTGRYYERGYRRNDRYSL